jgi:hypothetical protein
MEKLKLFISHSSRLDDDNGALDSDENWALLKGVCDEIRSREFGVEVEVLVDQFIGSGNDWEKYLNLWLAECHAAIILYSKRALTRSDWVQKEATILNWRWQVEPDFPLLPVFFEDETSIEDASDSIWETIGLTQVNSATCPKDDPSVIVTEFSNQPRFKDLVKQLKLRDIPTPFTEMGEELKPCLDDIQVFSDLKLAWDNLVDVDKLPDPVDTIDDLVNNLIRFLLTSPERSIEKLHLFTAKININRKYPRQRIQEVYATIRGFWVHAGAAGWLPTSSRRGIILALNGNRLDKPASTGTGSTKNFTVDRYINKAWRNKSGVFVPLTDKTARDEIERQIWDEYGLDLDELDEALEDEKDEIIQEFRDEVNQRDFILVYFPLKNSAAGIPDPGRIIELENLSQTYPQLRVLIGTGSEPLPDEIPGISQINPILDIKLERIQFKKDGPLNKLLCQ